jgi:tRNA(Ile2) C34 agmatinyltransferase TiaS
MKTANILKGSLLAILASVLSSVALADTASNLPVVNSHLQTVDATIAAIDPATRSVTLNGPNGLVTVQVGKQAKNFDTLKVGDKVTVSYYQGLAARMKPGDAAKAAAPVGAEFASAAGPGKVGGTAGVSVTANVTIQAIDLPTNTVAFKRSDGSIHVIEVKTATMKKFIRTLKPGDLVEVTYTESIAIAVKPAA